MAPRLPRQTIEQRLTRLLPSWLKRQLLGDWGAEGFKKYFFNTGWLLGSRVLNLGVSFFVSIYVVRSLGPLEYGTFAYAVGFASLFSMLGSLGIESILYRDLVKEPERRDVYLGTAFWLKVAGSVLALVLLIVVGATMDGLDGRIRLMAILIAVGTVLRSTSVLTSFFQARVESRKNAIVTIAAHVATSLAKVLVVWLTGSIVLLAAVFIVEALAHTVGLLIFYGRVGRVSAWRFDGGVARRMLGDSWPMMFYVAFSTIYARIDQVMLGRQSSLDVVGQYDVAVRLTELWYMVPHAVVISLFPAIVLTVDDAKQHIGRLQKMFWVLVLSTGAVSTVVALFARPLVRVLYGVEYAAAAPILTIYIWSLVGSAIGMLLYHYLVAHNHKRQLVGFALLTVVLNIVLNLIFIPRTGAVGAAWATLVSYSLAIVWFWFSSKSPAYIQKAV